MKYLIRILLLLVILTLGSCSRSGRTESTETSGYIKTNEAEVTFVELGSVNCVPCKMMQPIMEQVGIDFGDRVEVIFHDVWTDKGKPYAEEYGIQAIPTQVFLDRNGKEYYRHTGYFPQEELYRILEQGFLIDTK